MTSRGYLRRWQVGSTVLVILLTIAGTLSGRFVEGFYRDPYALVTGPTGRTR